METHIDADLETLFVKAAEETEQAWLSSVPTGDVGASVGASDEPATKKRKREIKEYEGTEEQFNLAWAKLKSLFHTHPAIFTKWLGEFMTNLVSLELKFGLDFYARLKPKQKQVCVDEAVRMEKKLERELGKDEDTKSVEGGEEKKTSKGRKKTNVMTISPEMYQKAWKAMAFVANPLLSSIEYNFLTNLGLRLREYKDKAIMAAYEQDLLVKLLESVPGRVALERIIE